MTPKKVKLLTCVHVGACACAQVPRFSESQLKMCLLRVPYTETNRPRCPNLENLGETGEMPLRPQQTCLGEAGRSGHLNVIVIKNETG